MKTEKSFTGFTLIELMIVITIIAILASIAYPSYQQHVIKARRVDAEGNLLELSQFMERFFTETGSYCNNTPPDTPCTTAPALPFTKSPKEGNATFYNIAFAANSPGANAFTLVATPSGSQNDPKCGALTLDSVGVKCITNGTKCSNVVADQAAVGACW
ncbi:MAG: type IV pilin protein [Gammaproteobacteria bacterium]